ncbi:hypothetical protein CQ13_33075 [Bradyrhizobium retamae]|uniref:Uncharacterized protein n=1 Tax=Bradyrhizobium retamae TaxID=1300035 RepID=A0A0R3MQF6_9BRAD|nr:hypothetical protein CQ13_33075 [Bradyrhizobium retamae]
MGEEELFVLDEQREQVRRRQGNGFEVLGVNDARKAGYLDDCFMQRRLAIQRLCSPESTIVSDHAAFDRPTIFQFNNAGKYAAVREVHLIDARAALRNDLAALHFDNAKMRPEVFKIDRACSGQNTIF